MDCPSWRSSTRLEKSDRITNFQRLIFAAVRGAMYSIVQLHTARMSAWAHTLVAEKCTGRQMWWTVQLCVSQA